MDALEKTEDGSVRIRFEQPDPEEFAAASLDQRIHLLRAILAQGKIAVTPLTLDQLLDEPIDSADAEIRARLKRCVSTADDLIYQLLADSIGNAWIMEFGGSSPLPRLFEFSGMHTVFLPEPLFHLLDGGGAVDDTRCTRLIQSWKWHDLLMPLEAVPKRFAEELADWRFYDVKRFAPGSNPGKGIVMEAMGMQDITEACRHRRYGEGVGFVVGREHGAWVLSAALKVEDFIPGDDPGRVAHQNHANDAMLLRRPELEEQARAIAPLYQQMNYYQWQGFREGYWNGLGRDAAAILEMLEGEIVFEILGIHGIEQAMAHRREGRFEEALRRCDESLFVFQQLDAKGVFYGKLMSLKTQLVRGDVLSASRDYAAALSVYDAVAAELRHWVQAGKDEAEVELASALAGSAAVCIMLGNRLAEARLRMREAQPLAQRALDRGVPFAENVLHALEQNLATVNRLEAE